MKKAISVKKSSNNIIEENQISGDYDEVISLDEESNNNKIAKNVINKNKDKKWYYNPWIIAIVTGLILRILKKLF